MRAIPPTRRFARMRFPEIGHGRALAAGRIPEPFLDWSFSLQRDTDTMRHDGNLIGAAGSIRGFDPSLTLHDSLLASISTPTLLFWGDNDPFGDAETARRLAAALPNAELRLLPGSGHLPWLGDPAGLASQTATFLA